MEMADMRKSKVPGTRIAGLPKQAQPGPKSAEVREHPPTGRA